MTTTVAAPPEQRIVLHDISWETYERLLSDHMDSSAPRFTYDRGELEILGPSTRHEEANRTLALLVELVAMEWSIEVRNVGSMTFRRRDLLQGFEPDSGFYVQNEERIRGVKQIDAEVDPPAHLVIEIEITRSAVPKVPIYHAMGVPEIWRWDGERVIILRLTPDGYAETDWSLALPPLSSETLTQFIVDSQTLRRTEWARRVREWAQSAAAS